MALTQQGRDLVSQIDNTTRQIESIAGLKRLGAHEEVKVFWQKAQVIMAKVDWESQNKTLDGITQLTRTYTALEFADFYSSLPRLIQYTEKAKSHANKAASSLGEAAEQFGALSGEVQHVVTQLSSKAGHHDYWEKDDEETAKVYGIVAHAMALPTVGLSYLLMLARDAYKERAANHAQSLKIIRDVQSILSSRIGPVFLEASQAMDEAASFFDRLSGLLHEVKEAGLEAQGGPASELHLHFLEMREVMCELRKSVQDLSVKMRMEDRRIA